MSPASLVRTRTVVLRQEIRVPIECADDDARISPLQLQKVGRRSLMEAAGHGASAASGRLKPGRKPEGSGRVAVFLMQLQVHIEDVDQLLTNRASPWSVGLVLQNAVDIL